MADVRLLETQKAQAIHEAMQTVEDLLGEPSGRLHSAQYDVAGRTMPDYLAAMLISELARVVAHQQERIEALEEQLDAKHKATAKK